MNLLFLFSDMKRIYKTIFVILYGKIANTVNLDFVNAQNYN